MTARNCRQAANVTRGPWSPPMQSTARVVMGSNVERTACHQHQHRATGDKTTGPQLRCTAQAGPTADQASFLVLSTLRPR